MSSEGGVIAVQLGQPRACHYATQPDYFPERETAKEPEGGKAEDTGAGKSRLAEAGKESRKQEKDRESVGAFTEGKEEEVGEKKLRCSPQVIVGPC